MILGCPPPPRQSHNSGTLQDQGRVLGLYNEHDSRSADSTKRSVLSNEGDEMKDNITDWALQQYHTVYKDYTITKEDIFYYTYGILHHPVYRIKYQANLVRGLPHIPMAVNFWTFSKAGRQLAKLHLNFDKIDAPRYNLGKPLNSIPNAPRKIQFGTKSNSGDGPKTIPDHAVLKLDGVAIYDNIPEPNYKVNGRTPVQWFVDRYKFTTNDKNGITNYPLQDMSGDDIKGIIERLVYIGLESDRIVKRLAKKEFEMDVAEFTNKPGQTGLDSFSKVET